MAGAERPGPVSPRRSPPRAVGVVGNPHHHSVHQTVHRFVELATEAGIDLYLERDLLGIAPGAARLIGEHVPALDLLLTFGGDGTLLRGARLVAPHGIPVLGVNLGHLGFLTSVAPDELETAVAHLLAGEVVFDNRMVLRASAETGDGTERGTYLALNDAVLHKGGLARVVRIAVYADGQEVGTYRADGIILSTPTGSTAYSLSAGGPIVSPSLDCIVATPICPHTLAVRPLVLPPEELITVEILDTVDEMILTIDGQDGVALAPGEKLVVCRAPTALHLVRFPGQTFFDTLRRKLRWGDIAASDDR
jgi:NAD+ kinase